MTVTEIFRETDARTPTDLAAVVRHAKELEEVRQLSSKELGALLDQYVEATDPTEVERLIRRLPKVSTVEAEVPKVLRARLPGTRLVLGDLTYIRQIRGSDARKD